MRRVLMVAYYFPPSGGAGVQRPLKFAKYLPEFGWICDVLTVHDGSFFAEDASLQADIPAQTTVIRAASVEPERLGFLRRRRRAVAQSTDAAPTLLTRALRQARRHMFPDAQIGWAPFAVAAGWRRLQRCPYDAIVSTCGPMSCHLVGDALARLSGLPWVADFRDPWADDPMQQLAYPAWQRALERHVVRHASWVTSVTAPLTQALQRHDPQAPKFTTLTNGYDPADIPADTPPPEAPPWQLTFVGTLYGHAVLRPLLEALARYRQAHPADLFHVRFVGQMDLQCASRFAHDTEALGLADICQRQAYVPHHQALQLMQASHVLLLPLYEGEGLRLVLPGKLFEYLACGRPILAMSAGGAAADLINQVNGGMVVGLHDADAAYHALVALRRAPPKDAPAAALHGYSRKTLTGQLATILDALCRAASQPLSAYNSETN